MLEKQTLSCYLEAIKISKFVFALFCLKKINQATIFGSD